MKIPPELYIWYASNARELPWRNTRNPYHIWLSEIMLQQTRVEQALPYYKRFLQRFPAIQNLADAGQEEVFTLWEGLGYYRRAANLLRTAQIIVHHYNGRFPSTAQALEKLPGIGHYTAAAIASLAFDEPVAVLDGNVMRVLARFTGSHLPVNSSTGQKHFRQLAQNFLNKKNSALHNQALMELGALICTPKNPRCTHCPIQNQCTAYNEKNQTLLPVKIKKKPIKNRYIHYIYASANKLINIQIRTHNDIWQGLYEFPHLETKRKSGINFRSRLAKHFGINRQNLKFIRMQTHLLTHRKLHLYFWKYEGLINTENTVPITRAQQLPMPVPLKRFLENQTNNPNFEI